jgi:hypothetical protein
VPDRGVTGTAAQHVQARKKTEIAEKQRDLKALFSTTGVMP